MGIFFFLITNLVSSFVIGLIRFSIDIFSLESVLVVCIFLGICPFHLDYQTCLHTVFHNTCTFVSSYYQKTLFFMKIKSSARHSYVALEYRPVIITIIECLLYAGYFANYLTYVVSCATTTV